MATPPDADDLYLHVEAAKTNNALYTNRVFAQPLGEGLVRLNFGENHGDWEPSYHSAFIMTPETALEVARVLQTVAAGVLQHQQELADAQAKADALATTEATLGDVIARELARGTQDDLGKR